MAYVTQYYDYARGRWRTWINQGVQLNGYKVSWAPIFMAAGTGLHATGFMFRTVWMPGPLNTINQTLVGSSRMEAPNATISFSTNGSVIPYAMGTTALSGQKIWAKGIEVDGASLPGDGKLTFADAYCLPLDPDEVVTIGRIWANGIKIYDPTNGPLIPGLTVTLYQGTETQGKDPDIVADKTDARATAYRGLRYIVFKNFPLAEVGGGVPTTMVEFIRYGDRLLLSEVIERVGERCGITVNVENIPDECDGIVFPAGVDIQQFLRDNRDVYNFDIIEEPDATLTVRRRPVNESLVIDHVLNAAVAGDLVSRGKDDPIVTFPVTEPTEIPRKVNVLYIDQERDYDQNIQVADLEDEVTPSRLPRTHQLNAGHTAEEAVKYAWDVAVRLKHEAVKPEFGTRSLRIRPGDTITLLAGGEFTLKCEEVAIDRDNVSELKCKAMQPRDGVDAQADVGDVLAESRSTILTPKSWISIRGSADLSKTVALAVHDFAYRSLDGGRTYKARLQPGQWQWRDGSCDTTGMIHLIVNQDGGCWVTFNAGDRFEPAGPIMSLQRVKLWNGGTLAYFGVSAYGTGASGPALLVGIFSGPTQIPTQFIPPPGGGYEIFDDEQVVGLDSSDDGDTVHLLIREMLSGSSYLVTSGNSGVTWGSPVSLPDGANHLSCSADGQVVSITFDQEDPWFSTNGGVSGTQVTLGFGDYGRRSKVTPDGSKIAVAVGAGSDAPAYLSVDSGGSFTGLPNTIGGFFTCIDIADDGSKILMGSGEVGAKGYIWRINSPFTTWVQQTS